MVTASPVHLSVLFHLLVFAFHSTCLHTWNPIKRLNILSSILSVQQDYTKELPRSDLFLISSKVTRQIFLESSG